MDWPKAWRRLALDVVRNTLVVLVLGALLEFYLSRSGAAFRPQVPLILAFVAFALSLSGSLSAAYLAWVIVRNRERDR